VFTFDDIEQIAFLQIIYIILLIYFTRREIVRKPTRTFFGVMLSVDIIYTVMIVWVTYTLATYTLKDNRDLFGWFLFMLAAFGPGILILFAFVIYEVTCDVIKYIRIIIK